MHVLQIQRAEISFSARHQGVNYIFALKNMTVSSFSNRRKHEDITVKKLQWDEDIAGSSFSLYYTWCNGLCFYNRMILAMIKIMFIHLGIAFIWEPGILICGSPVSFVTSASRDSKSKSAGLKWQQYLQNGHCCYVYAQIIWANLTLPKIGKVMIMIFLGYKPTERENKFSMQCLMIVQT